MVWMLLTALAASLVGVLLARRARRKRLYEASSISPQTLNALIQSGKPYELFDVRLPLDLLADAAIIPGAKRVSPSRIAKDADLIPRDHDTIVYCTCPSDESSQRTALRARSMGYTRVKFLRGGLSGWREAGFAVQPFDESFELDGAA